MYYLLLFICITSRLATTIYYIEDIDSLRFALSVVDEFSINKLQPHFPGYPIFCFLANLIYKITQNLGLTFSIIGGSSIFIIIIASLKILNIKLHSINGLILSLFILLNPILWLMSNRYMPDLLGLAFLLSSFYYLSIPNCKKSIYIGALLAGLLIGTRLSYLPILLLPIIQSSFNKKINYKVIFSILLGVLAWLIPIIYLEGLSQLISLGYKHTIGHFFDYGGTIITESNLMLRLKFLLETVWADGLGGFWLGRHTTTLITSIIISLIFHNILKFKKIDNLIVKRLLITSAIYIVWLILFQNLIHKSRHVIPLVLVIILFISSFINQKNIKMLIILYIISIFPVSYNIINNHIKGTAISKIINYDLINKSDVIITNQLINYYLKANGNTSKFYNIEEENSPLNPSLNTKNIAIIGHYTELFTDDYLVKLDTIFYHNPYMNRMWSEIPIYTLNR